MPEQVVSVGDMFKLVGFCVEGAQTQGSIFDLAYYLKEMDCAGMPRTELEPREVAYMGPRTFVVHQTWDVSNQGSRAISPNRAIAAERLNRLVGQAEDLAERRHADYFEILTVLRDGNDVTELNAPEYSHYSMRCRTLASVTYVRGTHDLRRMVDDYLQASSLEDMAGFPRDIPLRPAMAASALPAAAVAFPRTWVLHPTVQLYVRKQD